VAYSQISFAIFFAGGGEFLQIIFATFFVVFDFKLEKIATAFQFITVNLY